jgi:hypothetical protein
LWKYTVSRDVAFSGDKTRKPLVYLGATDTVKSTSHEDAIPDGSVITARYRSCVLIDGISRY